MPHALAIIVADLHTGRLGHPRSLATALAGRPVLHHTAARAARLERVQKVVVVHPPGQDPLALIDPAALGLPLETLAHPAVAGDALTPRRRAARRWATAGWRGGLQGATAWDELLPAAPIVAALEQFHADAAALVGGDWCLFDPAYADELLKLHLDAPQAMKLTFTQAPPGLGPVVTSRAVLHDLAQKQASIGGVLAYSPPRPALDPIGRECNHPIPAPVRDLARRFIYDTPDGTDRLHQLADRLGDRFGSADALAVTDACRALELDHPGRVFDTLPPQITLELTPRRIARGPITPQHYFSVSRDDMDPGLARDVLSQCAGRAVTLGGLGDATLHPHWAELADAAVDAGADGLHLETDLLAPRDRLAPLVQPGPQGPAFRGDIISVRLNADTAETYRNVMGVDRFADVMETLQWLFDQRSQHAAAMPWIIPRLTKTPDTLQDMESFFERWKQLVGHAVIDRPWTCGRGRLALAPDLSPVPMDPPPRPPSPWQVKHRLTVLSDGTVTLCAQDVLGRAPLGNVREHSLLELWQNAPQALAPWADPARTDSPLCRRCADWISLRRDTAKAGGAS
ncbi:MAG: SPASM domain-containing protein [Planctomycetota bacterium]